MKNCFTCDLAKQKADTVRCGFKPTMKQLQGFPFYPVVLVKITKAVVNKANVPERDCPTWKPKKPTPADKA